MLGHSRWALHTEPLDKAIMHASRAPGPQESTQAGEVRDKVLEAIPSLSPPLRKATMLFYIDGYSQQEVAEFLDIPVKSRASSLVTTRMAIS